MLNPLRQFFRRFFHPITHSQYSTGIHLYNEGQYQEAANAFGLIREGIYRTSVLYNRLTNFYYYRALRNASLLAFYRNDFISCIRYCQQALEVTPDDLVCRNYLAHSFHRVGQYGAAIKQLEALRNLAPKREDVLFNLAKINIKAGRTEAAREIIDELIERNPDYADFHQVKGIAYGKEGNIDMAITNFKRAVEINPGYSNAILLLGLEQIRSFEYEEAKRTFKRGIDQCPDNIELLFYYGLTSTVLGRMARVNAERTVVDSDNPLADQSLPKDILDDIAYLDSKALDEHYKMLELDISYGEHFTFLDPIYDKPALRSLVDAFESLIAVYPAYADYYNKLGSFYKKIGETERAIDVLKTAIELNPEYVDALDNLAGVYESEGRFEEAFSLSERIIEKQPDNAEHLIKRGRLCVKLGYLDQAAEAFITASRLDSRYTYHLYVLGQILKENDNSDLAARCWRVASELLPEAARDLRGIRRLERSLR